MSTLPRERVDVAHPSPSLALVPARTASAPTALSHPQKVAFALFFIMGYMGSGLLLLSGWVGAVSVDARNVMAGIGILSIAVAGPGVLAHAVRRRDPRKMLGGLAVLVAVGMAEPLVGRVAEEVYAGRMISALEPLAADLAPLDGVDRLEISARGGWPAPDPWVSLNGVQGRYGGRNLPSTEALAGEMARVGLTPAALVELDRRMREARVGLVEAREGHLVFRRMGMDRWRLLFVPPGRALSPRALPSRRWTTEPLGGGWYLLR